MPSVEIFMAVTIIILINSNIFLWAEIGKMKKIYKLTLVCLDLLGGKDE